MNASSKSVLLMLAAFIGAAVALFPLLRLVQTGLFAPAAERSAGEVLRVADLRSESGVLPEGYTLLGAPLMSASGERMLFHAEARGGGEAMFLWEQGAGLRRIAIDGSSFLFSIRLNLRGSAAVFFQRRSADERGHTLSIWEEGVGVRSLIEGVFFGAWELSFSGEGTRVALFPLGSESRYLASEESQADGERDAFILTQTDEGVFVRERFAQQEVVEAVRLETNELSLFRRNAEDRQAFTWNRKNLKASPDLFDVNGDRAEDFLSFEPPVKAEPFWRAFALSGFSGTRKQASAVSAYTGSWRAGVAEGVPVPADYNGDGKLDLATYLPDFYPGQEGKVYNWKIYFSDSHAVGMRPSQILEVAWGFGSMQAVPADYDGDGASDIAVFAPGTGRWHVLYASGGFNKAKAETKGDFSAGQSFQWGLASDCLLPIDFNGDGCSDLAVLRRAEESASEEMKWFIRYLPCRGKEAASKETFRFGRVGDIPIPADFNGDGRSEAAVYRPSSGEWFIRVRADKILREKWHVPDAEPLAADFDGDGSADLAFYSSKGPTHWQVQNSTFSPKLQSVFPHRAPSVSKFRWGSSVFDTGSCS